MKSPFSYTLLISIFLFHSCMSGDCDDKHAIAFGNNDELFVSECYVQVELQGIDSEVGQIKNDELGIVFDYDIGYLASHYVDTTNVDAVKLQSVNEPFWYEKRTQCNIGSNCYYVTFTNTGPANFIVQDDGHWVEVLDVLKTYESK